jgi:hypothetical protein
MVKVKHAGTVALLLLIAGGATASAQMSPFPGGGGGRGVNLPPPVPDIGKQPPKKQKQDADAMPSFTGTVRVIDAKVLTIERPDANTLDFNCTKKTKYLDGSKKIKVKDVKAGDRVSVEAKRALDGSLDAVTVHVERGKSS